MRCCAWRMARTNHATALMLSCAPAAQPLISSLRFVLPSALSFSGQGACCILYKIKRLRLFASSIAAMWNMGNLPIAGNHANIAIAMPVSPLPMRLIAGRRPLNPPLTLWHMRLLVFARWKSRCSAALIAAKPRAMPNGYLRQVPNRAIL